MNSPWAFPAEAPPEWVQSTSYASPWHPGGRISAIHPSAGATPFQRPAELASWPQSAPPQSPWPQSAPPQSPWHGAGGPPQSSAAFDNQPLTSGYFGANENPWNAVIRTASYGPPPPAHPPWPTDRPSSPLQWAPPSRSYDFQSPWTTPGQNAWDISRPKTAGPELWGERLPSQGFSTPAHLKPDVYDEKNLARRPRDWRPNYSPHAGFLSSLSPLPFLKNQSDVSVWSDPVKRRLNSLLQHQPNRPPVSHDLRLDPFNPSTPLLHASSGPRTPFNQIDLAQLATTPTAIALRLFHPRLPWYIDVEKTQPNGITVLDVLTQLYTYLHTQIRRRHYYNEVLNADDRGRLSHAYKSRLSLLGGSKEIAERGILWVDFLGDDVILEGFTRVKGGLWEIKTRKSGYH